MVPAACMSSLCQGCARLSTYRHRINLDDAPLLTTVTFDYTRTSAQKSRLSALAMRYTAAVTAATAICTQVSIVHGQTDHAVSMSNCTQRGALLLLMPSFARPANQPTRHHPPEAIKWPTRRQREGCCTAFHSSIGSTRSCAHRWPVLMLTTTALTGRPHNISSSRQLEHECFWQPLLWRRASTHQWDEAYSANNVCPVAQC